MEKTSIAVWDLPIRLFHWLLVVAVGVAYLSIKTDLLESEWHGWTGVLLTYLWLFRFCWGFLGSRTARFSHFFPTPRRLLLSFKQPWLEVGHSPTAGLSVVALLLLLAGMIVTGLFASDDISLQGPFAATVSEAVSDTFSAWHAALFNGLLALISLHLLAIFYYWQFKNDNLITPMLTGHKPIGFIIEGNVAPRAWRYVLNLTLCLLFAALLTWLIFSPQAHALIHPLPPSPVVPVSQHHW